MGMDQMTRAMKPRNGIADIAARSARRLVERGQIAPSTLVKPDGTRRPCVYRCATEAQRDRHLVEDARVLRDRGGR